MSNWNGCKKILCIRPDNRGDVLMSSPAFRALKESFNCSLSLLTSSAGAGMAPFLPCIDEVIVYDMPWVKAAGDSNEDIQDLAWALWKKKFDAAVVFTVSSQNPLPSVMISYMAGIPRRLAYCRENPYQLLTKWAPDPEPYYYIRHQVRRDLDLVQLVGATTDDDRLQVEVRDGTVISAWSKLAAKGVAANRPWVIVHPGASEKKRCCSIHLWTEIIKRMVYELELQVVVTGSGDEMAQIDDIVADIAGLPVINAAGLLDMDEFVAAIKIAPLVVCVNTVTAHIAAAVNTPVIVLYAMSNPEHLPWKAYGKILPFEVPEELRSRNTVISYIHDFLQTPVSTEIAPSRVIDAVREILEGHPARIPELPPCHKPGETIF